MREPTDDLVSRARADARHACGPTYDPSCLACRLAAHVLALTDEVRRLQAEVERYIKADQAFLDMTEGRD